MELLQTALQASDPASGVAVVDRQLTFEAAPDRNIRLKRMRFGNRDQPIQVLFGALEIAGSKNTKMAQTKAMHSVTGWSVGLASLTV